MNESSLWAYLKRGMTTKWHATRIESSAGNGVPDVSFAIPGRWNSWVELKYVREWPKKDATKVKLPLRPEQKLWIKNRGSVAGDVWVMVRIADAFFLLTWEQAVEATSGWTQKEWRLIDTQWEYEIDFPQLTAILAKGC